MRISGTLFLLFWLAAWGQSPAATLDETSFAAQFREVFYDQALADVKMVDIRNVREKELLLDNLAHLPALGEITFSELEVAEADFARIAPHANITQIEFSRFTTIDPAALAVVKSLKTLEFYKCTEIPWAAVAAMRGPALRRLEIRDSYLDGDDLSALSAVETFESITLSEPKGVSDDALANLGKFKNLQSLSVYNVSDSRGEFIAALKGLKKLREFNFTGRLTATQAQRLADLPNLQAIQLNIKEPLPNGWYKAIAENCRGLVRLELHYQALDKTKIDNIAMLTELTELKCYSDTQIADMSFGGPRVKTEPGDLAALAALKKLQSLHLSRGYRLNAEDGAAIASLAKLTRLELWFAQFEPGALEKLGDLTELTVLSLYGSRGLDTTDAKAIGALQNLEELNLSIVTKAAGADFSHLRGLAKLRELDLTDFRGLSDDDMAMFTGLKSLEDLTLRRNARVSDKGLSQLRHATKLSDLWMVHMSVNGTGFADWPADHALKTVFIEGTAINDDGLKALSRLRNLASVEIRIVRLFGGDIEVDIACFVDTPSLEYVSILGSYRTTPAAIEKLTKARPELSIFCPSE